MSPAAAPLLVGVFPLAAEAQLTNLFRALEEAFPVRFEGRRDGGLRGLDAALELGPGGQAEAATAFGLPALAQLTPEGAVGEPVAVQELGRDPLLDSRLRGAALPDACLGPALPGAVALGADGATVLAECRGVPTWARTGELRKAALAPVELMPGEALRERLRDGRSAALLPLVHFLRELTAPIAWRPPPARACFLFDDPNLHWPSYGFVKLAELGRHAREHGYHASLATVPLDGRLGGHPAAVRAMRESQGALSLSVHGNDHYGAELEAIESEQRALALAAQALRRTRAFGRRHSVPVEPVMVPPHEECSQAMMRALRRCGFEAITMTRPYPWLAPQPLSWLTRPADAGPLAGWGPSDRAEGLAVFLRHPFVDRSQAELTLRAFLGQPLILYGHQADLHDGLGILGEAAADVHRLGPTRWCSLGEIAAGSYETRHEGSSLAVRPLTRRALLEIPDDVDRLLVCPREDGTGAPATRLLVDGHPHRLNESLATSPGTTVELELCHDDDVDPSAVSAPPIQPLALPRRLLSEGRDRLSPLLARTQS